MADEFNTSAKLTRICTFALVGRIVPDDLEAVRALNSEAADLLATMAAGIGKLDATAIRDAADRARALGRMLSPESQANIEFGGRDRQKRSAQNREGRRAGRARNRPADH